MCTSISGSDYLSRRSSRRSHAFASFQSRFTVSAGHDENPRGLLDRQPADEPQLDDLILSLVDCRQCSQRVVERDDIGQRVF